MPGINGFDTTRQLRQLAHFSNLPVIAMTAHHGADTEQACFDAGMNGLLVKPIEANSLAAILKRWLA